MKKLKIVNLVVNIISLITFIAVLTKSLVWWQNMKERELNIYFSKSASGSHTPRISLPTTWIKEMGIKWFYSQKGS